SDVADRDGAHPAFRLVQKSGNTERLGAALLEDMHQVVQGHATIDDILHDDNVGAFEGNVEVFGDLDFARGAFTFAVSRDADEIDEDIALHGAGQIGEKKAGALQDADEVQIAGRIVPGNLFAHLRDARADFRSWD